jgi:hypothetical protein
MVVPVKKITIERLEGRIPYYVKKEFSSFDEATTWLYQQSPTFPDKGCDKHSLVVEFEDGEIYKGRLDCKRAACEDNDLDVKQHMIEFATWVAGLAKSPWCGTERYREWIARNEKNHPGIRESYQNLLDNYLLD